MSNDFSTVLSQFVGKYILYNDKSESNKTAKGVIHEIRRADIDVLDANSELIYEFNLFRRKVIEIRMNHESITNAEDYWEKNVKNLKGINIASVNEKMFIDVNRRLTNFIVSLNTLIYDFLIKRKLNKIFGDNSDEVKNFKLKTNQWFDAYLPYKFFITLRDFAVHYEFPLQIVHLDVDIDPDKDQTIVNSISIQFKKDKLLNFDKFQRKVAGDLTGYNHTFPLHPLLRDIEFIFDDILLEIMRITGNRYIKAAEEINNYLQSFDDPQQVQYGSVYRQGDEINLDTKIIYKESVEDILSLAEKL